MSRGSGPHPETWFDKEHLAFLSLGILRLSWHLSRSFILLLLFKVLTPFPLEVLIPESHVLAKLRTGSSPLGATNKHEPSRVWWSILPHINDDESWTMVDRCWNLWHTEAATLPHDPKVNLQMHQATRGCYCRSLNLLRSFAPEETPQADRASVERVWKKVQGVQDALAKDKMATRRQPWLQPHKKHFRGWIENRTTWLPIKGRRLFKLDVRSLLT